MTPLRSNEKSASILWRRRITCTRKSGFRSNSESNTICHVAGCFRGKSRNGSGTSGSHSTGKSEIQATVNGFFTFEMDGDMSDVYVSRLNDESYSGDVPGQVDREVAPMAVISMASGGAPQRGRITRALRDSGASHHERRQQRTDGHR